DKSDNPESAFIRKERQKRIVKAINSLKPKLREVIMMYEIDGLSYEDIAYTLNCPIGTVKSRLFNAKQELAEKLKDLI
ncbi:sigma-70 family RNA polymerase sigma factor, partial [bacterium]|nr:sigma-70 family RNA polymerase sigma factor [bacterium]